MDEEYAEPRERVMVRRRSQRYLKKQRQRRWWWVLGGIVAFSLLQLLWTVINLHGVVDKIHTAETAAELGDFQGAKQYVSNAHAAAERATWGTWGPQWWLLSQVPWVGDNVRAVQTVASSSTDFTQAALDDLFPLQQQLAPSRIRPVKSYINPAFFVAARPLAEDLATRTQSIRDDVDTVPTAGLLPGLDGLWSRFRGLIDKAGYSAQLGKNVIAMMPDALGTQGTRRYLILFQNNAEFRTTGGIPGSFSELTATGGHLTLGAKQSFTTVGLPTSPVLPLTAPEHKLFGDQLGLFTQDVNLTPDFARSGQLMAAIWKLHSGEQVDGIFSIDPVALSYVLRGTGPVTVKGATLTSLNAVPLLLNSPYRDLPDNQSQDDFFGAATHDVFDKLVHGAGNAAVALRGVFDGINAGRAMVWLANPDQQAGLLDAPVTKQLSTAFNVRPDVGVYFNDSTATKLEYYVASDSRLVSTSCHGGRQVVQVDTTIKSSVPDDVASFPPLLIGTHVGKSLGDLLITTYAYGPWGGSVIDTSQDGQRGSPMIVTHEGHPVIARTVLLPRGGSVTLHNSFYAAPGAIGDPMLRSTPSATSTGVSYVGATSCR